MSIASSISRLAAYVKRHGLRATVGRAGIATRRALFSNRMIILICDLSGETLPPPNFPNLLRVERKRSAAELSPDESSEIINIWNPKLAHENMKARFAKGASLWLIKSEGKLAGFGWTLRGSTMEPYFLPLGKDDPYLFDGFILPQYRGQGLMPLWLNHALHELAAERGGRAFTEIAEWNQAILSSLKKTPFRPLGSARKFTLFRRTMVCWDDKKTAELGGGEALSHGLIASCNDDKIPSLRA
jgi:hypothetical protein